MTRFPYRVLGGYRVLGTLGIGSFGTTLLGERGEPARRFVLRVASPDRPAAREDLERFVHALRASGLARAPGHVSLVEVGEDKGLVFLVREFVAGLSLEALGERLHTSARSNLSDVQLRWIVSGRLASKVGGETKGESPRGARGASPPAPPRERSYVFAVARIGFEAAVALEHSHRRGVLHGNLKPTNVIVSRETRVFLVDPRERPEFDLSRFAAGPTWRDHRRLLPPETLRRREYHRDADVYALGALLYDLLAVEAGKPSGAAERAALFRSSEVAPLRELNPRVPRDLDAIVWKAIDPRPEGRYARAVDLADDLRRFLLYESVSAAAPRSRERRRLGAGSGSLRRPAVAAAAAALVVGGGLGGVVAFLPWEPSGSPVARADAGRVTARAPAHVAAKVPSRVTPWLAKAREAFDRGDFPLARDLYDLILQVRPEDAARAERAEADVEASERRAEAMRKATALRASGDTAALVAALRSALESDPTDAALRRELSDAEQLLAQDPLETSLASPRTPVFLQALRSLAKAIDRGEYERGEWIGRIVASLDHPEPFVRGESARLLGALGGDEGGDRLLSLLDERDFFVYQCAVQACGRRDDARAFPLLVRDLEAVRIVERATRGGAAAREPAAGTAAPATESAFGPDRRFDPPVGGRDDATVRDALRSLGPSPTSLVLEAMLRVSSSAEDGFFRDLLEGYAGGRRGLIPSVSLLERIVLRTRATAESEHADVFADVFLAESDSAVRTAILDFLAEKAPGERPEVMREALDPVSAPEVRAAAIRVLGGLPEALSLAPLLTVVVEDPDVELRRQAIGLVSRSDDAKVTGTLVERLADPTEAAAIRAAAAAALAGREGRDLDEELARALERDPDPGVRRAAARAVAILPGRAGREALLRASAEDHDVEVRAVATEAVGAFPDPLGMERLETAAALRGPVAVRVAAAAALGDHGGGRAREALRRLLGAPEVEVRVAALRAIDRVGVGEAVDDVARLTRRETDVAAKSLGVCVLAGVDGADADAAIGALLSAQSDPRVRLSLLAAAVLRGGGRKRDAFFDGIRNAAGGRAAVDLTEFGIEERLLMGRALAATNDVRAVPLLGRVVQFDPSSDVRAIAAYALGALEGGAELLQSVAENDPALSVRLAARSALRDGASSESDAEVVEQLRNGADAFDRAAAADELARPGHRDEESALFDAAAGDDSALVRAAATRALASRGSLDATLAVEVFRGILRSDPNPSVRIEAAKALAAQGGPQADRALFEALVADEEDGVREAAAGAVRAALGALSTAAPGETSHGGPAGVDFEVSIRAFEAVPPSSDDPEERRRRAEPMRAVLAGRTEVGEDT